MPSELWKRASDAIRHAQLLLGATEVLLAASLRLHHDCRNTRNIIVLQRTLRKLRAGAGLA